MIEIGNFDRQITIETLSLNSVDAIGAPVETWSKVVQCWSKVVPMSGTEALRLDRQVSTETSRFFIRYRTGITVKDRISYAGKYWDILNIRELGRREQLEITAEVTI
jgi:SPP1 family predicted phage head-tail adaptor